MDALIGNQCRTRPPQGQRRGRSRASGRRRPRRPQAARHQGRRRLRSRRAVRDQAERRVPWVWWWPNWSRPTNCRPARAARRPLSRAGSFHTSVRRSRALVQVRQPPPGRGGSHRDREQRRRLRAGRPRSPTRPSVRGTDGPGLIPRGAGTAGAARVEARGRAIPPFYAPSAPI